ncbi:MAG: hypothetical protein ACM3PP_12720, partial [Candidatus Saccharibacteria bacterium]
KSQRLSVIMTIIYELVGIFSFVLFWWIGGDDLLNLSRVVFAGMIGGMALGLLSASLSIKKLFSESIDEAKLIKTIKEEGLPKFAGQFQTRTIFINTLGFPIFLTPVLMWVTHALNAPRAWLIGFLCLTVGGLIAAIIHARYVIVRFIKPMADQ